MPVVPDPDRPERRKLVEPDGSRSRASSTSTATAEMVADLFELEVPVQRALPDDPRRPARDAGRRLGAARARAVAAGGTPARHAHVYSHDLASARAAPAGRARALAGRPARGRSPPRLSRRLPPDHVDRAGDRRRGSAHLARRPRAASSGRCSTAAASRSTARRVVGAILIAESPTRAAVRRPVDHGVFRAPEPRAPGGRCSAGARARRRSRLGLAVTDGNPPSGSTARSASPRLTAFSVDL